MMARSKAALMARRSTPCVRLDRRDAGGMDRRGRQAPPGGASGSARHQPQQVPDAGAEHDEVDDDEGEQRAGDAGRGDGRNGIRGAEQAIDRVGLTAGLGDEPAGQQRDEAGRAHEQAPAREERRCHRAGRASAATGRRDPSRASGGRARPSRESSRRRSARAASPRAASSSGPHRRRRARASG